MKKIKYNIILLIIFLLLAEIICYVQAVHFQWQYIQKESFKYVFSRYFVKPTYIYYDVPSPNARPVAGKDFNKKPIILFGCSVTYGNKLDDNSNFSGILSEMTKRPVYNLAYDGWTISHMLRQLEVNTDIKDLDPEYIIYTFITDQKRRLYFYQGWPHDTDLYLRYSYDKNHKLQINEKKYPFFYRFLLVKTIQYCISAKKNKNEKNTSELMLDLFTNSVNIIKERYPNAKLIMLLYTPAECTSPDLKEIFLDESYLSKNEYERLTDLGFSIVNIEKEAGKVFCTPEYKVDDNHPSSKMWSEFIPVLIKKFNL